MSETINIITINVRHRPVLIVGLVKTVQTQNLFSSFYDVMRHRVTSLRISSQIILVCTAIVRVMQQPIIAAVVLLQLIYLTFTAVQSGVATQPNVHVSSGT